MTIPRVGFGYDCHRLVTGRPLILGGIEIPYKKGLLGHSDADALLHAIGDSLLGAAGAGDLGKHFPDDDPAYKNASSVRLLEHIRALVGKEGYVVNNIDATVVLEEPRLKDHIPAMTDIIARALNADRDRISIKATTNEGMGFIGKGEGIAAFSVASIIKRQD